MAQQDKTDWYWNGELAGAVNNLYYDLINVDVVHVPYATMNRNSSFFLQTRRNYEASDRWFQTQQPYDWHRWRDVMDVKCVWNDKCEDTDWTVYVLLANKSRTKVRVHLWSISKDWCVGNIDRWRERWRIFNTSPCGSFKLFTTWFVKWEYLNWAEIQETQPGCDMKTDYSRSWIQINKYNLWTTVWLFSDENVENGYTKFVAEWVSEEAWTVWFRTWQYILVYSSLWREGDWFAWQVRMITWRDWERLTVDAPWLWFKVLSEEWDEVKWWWLKYRIFNDWWEVAWFADRNKIYMITDPNPWINWYTEVYNQTWLLHTNIISVAEALNKIFVLTDNWYIHYNKDTWWYNKFFINEDMYAWADKTSIAAYRDIILAFGNRHIAVWIPNDSDGFWTMYNQSTSIWLWSRYSYAEYDWDLIFVSNDKRLLALWISWNASRYMLQHEDVWDMINWKLSALISWDEVFISNDKNNLRVFIHTKSKPYTYVNEHDAKITENQDNSICRIVKFDKLFKVWTEDLLRGILLQWVEEWVYFWENWLYNRSYWWVDIKWDMNVSRYDFKAQISAYLMENESDWIWWTGSRLRDRPKLYNLSKLNRLITTLWPGIYSHESKIRITSYVKWLWTVYEFPVAWDGNTWLWIMTTKFLWEEFDEEQQKELDCMLSVLDDSQKLYQAKCTNNNAWKIQQYARQRPWCWSDDELITFDKGVCIDDSLYEIAPTMPLVTALWENQQYSTQIKIELIGGVWDVITFGWWLAEMFIAPLFSTGPDWDYQLAPNTEC